MRTSTPPSACPPAVAGAFLTPSLLGLTAFFLAPFLEVVRRSFANATGEHFVGWDNYATVLGNDAFALAAGNTARFFLACIPLLLGLSLGLALLLRRSTPFRRLMKTALLLPLAVPVFTAALLISVTFDASGIANGALSALRMDPVAWLTTDAAFWVLVGNYVWRNLGYCVVLWLAALAYIPESLYEAARVDGASSARIAARITMPLLAPSFPVVLTLAVVNAFKVYREAYLVAGSYPPQSIYLLPHLFNNWFANLSVGKLAAAGVLVAAVLLALACLLLRAWNSSDGSRR